MEKYSLWKKDLPNKEENRLEKEESVDVLIIGGGMTGMSCCYHLMDCGLKVMLVEANKIGEGVTSKTTAKLTFLQQDIYSKIAKATDQPTAKLYYESQKEAISIVKDIIDTNHISCNLEKTEAYTFTNDVNHISRLKEEADLLKSFSEDVFQSTRLPNDTPCKYAIGVSDTYVFHPLKYLYGLKEIFRKRKIPIYENTRILTIDKEDDFYLCKSNRAWIRAKNVVLALHYPYFLLPYMMPIKVQLEKSYVGASKVENDLKFHAISIDRPVKSMRYYSDGDTHYQIFLYGSRNISMNVCDKEHFELLKFFPFSYEYIWSNIDILTGDSLPLIGKIEDHLFLATGYNTWGMTNGSLAGKMIADFILGKRNPYQKIFDPKRINLGTVTQVPIVLGSNVKAYTSAKMFPDKNWYPKNLKIMKRNGKSVGIYTDSCGSRHTVYTTCPHMGCGLIFNEVEHTWDCPCHGSRFDLDGKVIEGPSNYSISYKEE